MILLSINENSSNNYIISNINLFLDIASKYKTINFTMSQLKYYLVPFIYPPPPLPQTFHFNSLMKNYIIYIYTHTQSASSRTLLPSLFEIPPTVYRENDFSAAILK